MSLWSRALSESTERDAIVTIYVRPSFQRILWQSRDDSRRGLEFDSAEMPHAPSLVDSIAKIRSLLEQKHGAVDQDGNQTNPYGRQRAAYYTKTFKEIHTKWKLPDAISW